MKRLFTIICVLTGFMAFSQWNTDTSVNTLVADTEALDMQARATSDGQTYVVFWRNVAAPTNIELRMQIIDSDGNQTLGSEGMLVSDQIPMGSYTVLWNIEVDADDNLYIGVTGTGGGDPAYVFKMDSNGNALWGANGINIGNGNKVTLLPLSTGGLIVGWLGSNGSVMQKYDSNGEAVWTDPVPIGLSSGLAAPDSFFEISEGDIIVVFHNMFAGISSNLYAQRYDADGNAIWTNAVQLSDGTTVWNRSYTGVQDNDVVYMGYFASFGDRFDSYVQRINPDGTLPWGLNGSDFDVSQIYNEMETDIAFEAGSDYVWAVSRYTDGTQNQVGEFVQKFNKETGARLLSDEAKEVYPVGSSINHDSRLWLKGDNPLFLNRDGFDNGASPISLNAVLLDENGDFAWEEEARPMATYSATKGRVQFLKPVNNESKVVFVENKGDGDKIYIQNLVDDTVEIEEFSTASIFVSNPVRDEMIISSDVALHSISVYNMLGQQIMKMDFNGQTSIRVDTGHWNSGMYLVNLDTEKGIKKGIKIIKM